uniref:Ig-like domain-containing protein n=1 Tax=Oryzias melastigma TaxID=30732 RepID=A0A3B3DSQ6_ORYME
KMVTSILAFLCSFSLISVSLSEFVIVEVQHGGEVSLLCSNLSTFITNVFWFKMDQRSNATKITSMMTAESNATVKEGFKNGRFQMSSNITHVSLNISEVNFSDSGLYFCGLYTNSVAVIFDATFLQVEEAMSPVVGSLGSIIFVLVMVIIFLIVKIRSFQTGTAIIYHLHSSLTFQQIRRGPTAETELDQNRSR